MPLSHSAPEPHLRRKTGTRLPTVSRAAAGLFFVAAIAGCAFLLHFNLSTAGSLQLLLVVLVSLRWGFFQATIVSIASVASLNFLFTRPILQLTVTDPQNWVALATFEATALLVSGLSAKVQAQTVEARLQQARIEKLYHLSRAILLIDPRRPTGDQLSALIRELMQVNAVDFWVAQEWSLVPVTVAENVVEALGVYQGQSDTDDPELETSKRVLRLGTTPIGGMVLRGWKTDSLLADAVASLAAVAFERARAIEKENRAELARNAEQLRTAVLDGLAHGFKTPLTAVQTASSGLLAIGRLSPTQTELVSIIDEQATLLTQLTTRLLQTAALEAREMRLRRTLCSMPALLQQVLLEQTEATRARVEIAAPVCPLHIEVDAQLISLALLQLIDNAAKYSSVGSLISVTIMQEPTETQVIVANRGSIIRHEERERIFNRYYRGVDALHGPTGTGLGLSIVKKTAEAHGGRAWVESQENCTRFFITVQHPKGVNVGDCAGSHSAGGR